MRSRPIECTHFFFPKRSITFLLAGILLPILYNTFMVTVTPAEEMNVFKLKVREAEAISPAASILLHCSLVKANEATNDDWQLEQQLANLTFLPHCTSSSTFSDNENGWSAWLSAFKQTPYSNPNTQAVGWFIMAGSSTFLIPENIRKMIAPYGEMIDTSGFVLANEYRTTVPAMMPVIVLSETARHRLNDYVTKHPECFLGRLPMTSLGNCIQQAGMEIRETVDEKRRHRILPSLPEILFNTNTSGDDRNKDADHHLSLLEQAVYLGPSCCSDYAVAIHQLHYSWYRHYYYMIYNVTISY